MIYTLQQKENHLILWMYLIKKGEIEYEIEKNNDNCIVKHDGFRWFRNKW